jgi:hypothetical protein
LQGCLLYGLYVSPKSESFIPTYSKILVDKNKDQGLQLSWVSSLFHYLVVVFFSFPDVVPVVDDVLVLLMNARSRCPVSTKFVDGESLEPEYHGCIILGHGNYTTKTVLPL